MHKNVKQALGQDSTTHEWRIAVQFLRLNMSPAATLCNIIKHCVDSKFKVRHNRIPGCRYCVDTRTLYRLYLTLRKGLLLGKLTVVKMVSRMVELLPNNSRLRLFSFINNS